MEKLTWFKFSPIDWMMGKIQKVSEVTQLRYLRLMCLYWNKDCVLSIEDAEIEIDKKHLDILLSKKIIKTDNGFIKIHFLDEQKVEIYEAKNDRSKSGIIGNLKRWHKDIYNDYVSGKIDLDTAVKLSQPIADQSHSDSAPIAPPSQPNRKTSQRREEEIREEKNNIINNSAFAKICLSKEQWRETICMQNKINPGRLEEVISDFEKHLIATSDQKKNHSEFEKHFVNWIPKQDYSKASSSTTAGTNQRQPSYHDD